ncbi:MAG: hypothetical protein KC503_15940, partial [Myxococcales bacterium]|nr:hypothetical protein [Myxococcales bacterium]
DDDALQRLLEAARKTPSQQTIERAATAARALRVDRAFAERKLRRLSSAIRRARLDAEDRARFDRITKRILRAILDGRFVSASHEMQRALHRLRALR